MKLHLAGPLFTAAERARNAHLAAALRSGGHSADIRLDLPLASMAEVKLAVLDAIATLEVRP